MSFGPLRVVNDDLVRAREGFGAHPHRDAEIFSYIVDGAVTHQDSMGNKEALGRGCVQYMSAGKGVVHSVSGDKVKTDIVQGLRATRRHGNVCWCMSIPRP